MQEKTVKKECIKCGYINKADTIYCLKCGSKLGQGDGLEKEASDSGFFKHSMLLTNEEESNVEKPT